MSLSCFRASYKADIEWIWKARGCQHYAGVLDAEIKLDSARGRTFRSNNKYAVCGERRPEEGIPGICYTE